MAVAAMVAATGAWTGGAAAGQDPGARETDGSWTMHAALCAVPGEGPFRLRVEGGVAFLAGWATCPGYQHAVDYALPLEQGPDGGWRYEGPEARLHLDAAGGLVRFEDHNPVFDFWALFLP